jgi:hypothetical protein
MERRQVLVQATEVYTAGANAQKDCALNAPLDGLKLRSFAAEPESPIGYPRRIPSG